jgi:hypothetical protein
VWIAGEPAALQPLVLSAAAAVVLSPGAIDTWQSAASVGLGATALPFAALITAAAIAALVVLRPRAPVEPAPQTDCSPPDGSPPQEAQRPAQKRPDPLLAQMHHELRTPLNALIGFSEVMRHELHGPLGNARYQEYAAHISESGGRLLKASEDALAVAATMAALVADRRTLRRQRLPAASLVREAWAAADAASAGRSVELVLEDGDGLTVDCDWQATSVALHHLLAEALARIPPRGGVVVGMSRRDGAARMHIRAVVAPGQKRGSAGRACRNAGAPSGGLRVVLARSLLEMQGATLGMSAPDRAEVWSARIVFPACLAAGRLQREKALANAGTGRWPPPAALQERRAGSVASSAARASAGSRAAPPA